MKKLATFALCITISFLTLLPVTVHANAEVPPAADLPGGTLPGEGLPEDGTSSSAATDPQTQKEVVTRDFLTGAGVGVAFGFILGGVVIWFTKRN